MKLIQKPKEENFQACGFENGDFKMLFEIRSLLFGYLSINSFKILLKMLTLFLWVSF